MCISRAARSQMGDRLLIDISWNPVLPALGFVKLNSSLFSSHNTGTGLWNGDSFVLEENHKHESGADMQPEHVRIFPHRSLYFEGFLQDCKKLT